MRKLKVEAIYNSIKIEQAVSRGCRSVVERWPNMVRPQVPSTPLEKEVSSIQECRRRGAQAELQEAVKHY